MAGIVTLGNRAYERINRVLGLFGIETVNDIDLSVAFPVHDLTPVVEAGLGGIWTFHHEFNAVGASTLRAEVNPNDGTDWDVVVTPSNSIITSPTDADVPDLDDYDIWILWFGGSYDANCSDASVYLKTSIGVSGDYTVALANLLINDLLTDGVTTALIPANSNSTQNAGYYNAAVPMPYRLARRFTPEARVLFAGAGNFGFFMQCYAAPIGVVPTVMSP